MTSEVKWLSREEQVSTATDAELRRSLLTGDGMGKRFKAACLDELVLRAMGEGVHPDPNFAESLKSDEMRVTDPWKE